MKQKIMVFVLLMCQSVCTNPMIFIRRVRPSAVIHSYREFGNTAQTTATYKKLEELKRFFPTKVQNRYIDDFREDFNKIRNTEQLRDEWIRYALLVRLSGENLSMFSKSVDNMWHTFLLFSAEYEKFCLQLPLNLNAKPPLSQSMLYHIPYDDDTRKCPRYCQNSEKQKFIKKYKELYNELPDIAIWSALKPCKSSCESSGHDVSFNTLYPLAALSATAIDSSNFTSKKDDRNSYPSCGTGSSCSSCSSCGGCGCGG